MFDRSFSGRSPEALLLTASIVSGAAAAPPTESSPPPSPPNFVFILAEATGWSSTSVDLDGEPPSHARGAELTPHLSRLASEGMRFSDFYVTSPRCTPSRASFVTGLSPSKLRMTYQSDGGRSRRDDGSDRYTLMRMIPPEVEANLPEGVRTTGDVLRELGYGTAHFGKWHAGRADPKANGFDASDGPNSNQGPERGSAPNPTQCVEIVDKGLAFMREQLAAGRPFFVQLSHYGFGGEDEATPESLEIARRVAPGATGKPLGAIAGQHDMDRELGRLREALVEMGVAGHTYIFFSADHGAQGGGGAWGGRASANPPFSGAKGSVSEGGIRVPFIAHGPGIPAGVTSRVRATSLDLLPTLRDLAGTPLESPAEPDAPLSIEGGSLVPVLKSSGEHAGTGAIARPREEIVIHFPHYDLGNGGPASAIYLGDLKLVRNDDARTVKLYDIARDRGEANDLAASMPEQAKALEARLDGYLKAVKAPMARVKADAEASAADQGVKPAADGGSASPADPVGDRGGASRRRGGGQERGAGGARRRGSRPQDQTSPAEPAASPPPVEAGAGGVA